MKEILQHIYQDFHKILPGKLLCCLRKGKTAGSGQKWLVKARAGEYTGRRQEVGRVSRELWQLIGLYLAVVNLWSFCAMGADKRRAKKGAWRLPEKALFLPAVLFGALGGLLGMKVFHHKTKHWYFRWGFPLLLVLQLAALGWLGWRFILN